MTGVPLQTVVLVRLVANVGVAVTFTLMVVGVLQAPFDPVTVYVVVTEGVTVMAAVFCPPGNHE